ncbi:MAG: hypothetical protein GY758_31685 [Fuerstiella sp.]|nr:hypothetical protein [Fuerstiella sp.]MCP4508192.1 hypothetical protein [Fuerstiella sp.]
MSADAIVLLDLDACDKVYRRFVGTRQGLFGRDPTLLYRVALWQHLAGKVHLRQHS